MDSIVFVIRDLILMTKSIQRNYYGFIAIYQRELYLNIVHMKNFLFFM